MRCLEDLLKETCVLHYKDIDLGLDRCLALLHKLGNPHLRIPPVFHVAGTNGKGSTLAFIKQILEDNGYSVHRYTSPHLVRFNERIELCGKQADDDVLADALAEILRINGGAPITTFEAITCMAFMLFAQTPADFTLLEVGMGGRLDATNVIQHPLITGITSISLDHQAELGDNVNAIAFEKSGIIKPSVPIVVPVNLMPSVHGVIAQRASALDAPLMPVQLCVWRDLGLHGVHQQVNASIAVQMVESAGIKCVNVEKSLQRVEWPGRLQCINLPQGELWVDGAHNEAGAEALAQSLRQLNKAAWTFFIHIKARKDLAAILRCLAPHAQEFYFVDFPIEGGDGAPVRELLDVSTDLGIKATLLSTMDEVVAAMEAIDTPMIATGSLFWVGKVLAKAASSLHKAQTEEFTG